MALGLWQILIILVYVVIWVVPFWRIFSRVGWPPALSLLMCVPLINFILLWIFAFAKWQKYDVSGAFK